MGAVFAGGGLAMGILGAAISYGVISGNTTEQIKHIADAVQENGKDLERFQVATNENSAGLRVLIARMDQIVKENEKNDLKVDWYNQIIHGHEIIYNELLKIQGKPVPEDPWEERRR
jgi:multimeric flavodoxin WrbA